MYFASKDNKAPIFGINKLRIESDGLGITTLVSFMGCPLQCKYCLNKKCHEPIYESDSKNLRKDIMMLSPQELYDLIQKDNIYSQNIGSICFSGGEPTLYKEFIIEFKELCEKKWKITLETCLRCSYGTIKELSSVVDYWIIDIKSINPFIYQEYTGVMSGVSQHLRALQILVPQEIIAIKVPYIPGYNDGEDLDSDIDEIKHNYGFRNVSKVEYKKL